MHYRAVWLPNSGLSQLTHRSVARSGAFSQALQGDAMLTIQIVAASTLAHSDADLSA